MNEIKFEVRIKHKATGNLWTEKFTIDELLDRNGCLYSPSIQEVVYRRQYTGLKDKNGVEVYVGDIVKSFYGVGTYTVIFKNGTFGMQGNSDYLDDWNRPKNYAYYPFKNIDNGTTEVIGNIYENKELIK